MHIMIDLETMGTTPDAPILSIGAARFSAMDGVTHTSYWLIDGASDLTLGAKPDWATIMWWMRQPEGPRMELADPARSRLSIVGVLHGLSRFIRDTPGLEGVWGNGPSFDNALLAAAYRRAKIEFPYHFGKDRCFRTLRALYPNVTIPPIDGAHNALVDATWQAALASRILAEHAF